MTREKAIEILKENLCAMCAYGSQSMMSCDIRGCDNRDAIQALEQESCDDWCNVLSDKMTLEQARQAVKDLRKKLAECLWQEPCDDCISRQATIKYLCTNMNWYDADGGTADDEEKLNAITDLVNGVPSVTPQPKIGRWINTDATHSKCDRCGAVFEIVSANGEANYCPNCGAKMQEVEE